MPNMAILKQPDGTVIVPVRLEPRTLAWLAELGRESGHNPITLIQSMIEMIQEDDERHHCVQIENYQH